MRFAPGEQFRHLQIGKELGRGAFATVFLAHDTLVDRTVALKVVRVDPSVTGKVKRSLLIREARLAGRLSSPNIVTVHHLYDLGAQGLVIEMEYVNGPTLGEELDARGRLPVPEAMRILRGTLSALQAAHDNEIVHRDVKPGNVLLGQDGAVKLADFGLSLSLAEQSLSVSSMEGMIGTPQYVAPEVIGGGRATAAADIWSVGVLAHRMFCGRLPFEAQSLPELFEQIQYHEPQCVHADVPPGVKLVLRACFAKDPLERPRSCAHILAGLEDVLPARSVAARPV